ncbi:hypothetical protein Bbelb_051620 [Branchiostoma belcheri]|nr:hypothetical protein Bbelb_051620 [Branchiostoma belcheri]
MAAQCRSGKAGPGAIRVVKIVTGGQGCAGDILLHVKHKHDGAASVPTTSSSTVQPWVPAPLGEEELMEKGLDRLRTFAWTAPCSHSHAGVQGNVETSAKHREFGYAALMGLDNTETVEVTFGEVAENSYSASTAIRVSRGDMGEASEGSSRDPKLGVYLQSPVKPFNFVKKKYGDAFPYRLSDTTIAEYWEHVLVPLSRTSTRDGWEAFKRDMSVLAFFEKYLDDPLKPPGCTSPVVLGLRTSYSFAPPLMFQAAASTTAAVPRVRVTRPDGTLLALAEDRGRQGEAGHDGVTIRDVQMTGCDREPPGEWAMRPMITFVQDWPSVHSYLHASHRYVDHLSYEPSSINAQRTRCFRRDMFRRPQAFPGLNPIDQPNIKGPSQRMRHEINIQAVWGFMSVGDGYANMSEVMSVMGVLTLYGKSLFHIEFGVRSCWETRDPRHPEEVEDKDRRDVFARFRRAGLQLNPASAIHFDLATVRLHRSSIRECQNSVNEGTELYLGWDALRKEILQKFVLCKDPEFFVTLILLLEEVNPIAVLLYSVVFRGGNYELWRKLLARCAILFLQWGRHHYNRATICHLTDVLHLEENCANANPVPSTPDPVVPEGL